MRNASILACFALSLALAGCTQNLSGPSCEQGLSACADICVNFQADNDNCGACGTTCGVGESCVAGACEDTCPADQVYCGGACVDPATNDDYCGATADCQGVNQGEQCDTGESCQAGACACAPGYQDCGGGVCADLESDNANCGACFNQCPANSTCQAGDCIYDAIIAGALPPSNGRWSYGGVIGIAGADAECSANWAQSYACTRAELELAQVAGQLTGLTDTQGTTVTALWVEDPSAQPTERCVDPNQENIPWSYQTAHLLHYGFYATLDNAAGTLGPVEIGMCNTAGANRVACCYR